MMQLSILILIALGSALLTQRVANLQTMNAIKSSALLSLVFYLFLSVFSQYYEWVPVERWSALFFGGSFVGMTAKSILHPLQLSFAALVYGLVFFFSYQYFLGIGGALGVSACFSVIFVKLVSQLIDSESVNSSEESGK